MSRLHLSSATCLKSHVTSITQTGPAWGAVFTNRLEDMRLQDLAEMDVKFLVHEVSCQTLRMPAT